MKQTIIMACGFFVCMAFSTGTVFAGGAPSVDSCKNLGFIQCDCIMCESGIKFGMVGVEAEYDSKYGDCMKRYREARQRCADAYGKALSEVGIKWSYKVGTRNYWGSYPSSCGETPNTSGIAPKTSQTQ